jgi:hypothetical protein
MVPAPCRSDNVSTCNPTATTPTASIKVMEQLKGFYAGQQVVLLWDGLSAHWSHRMRAHLDAERGLAHRRTAARLRPRAEPGRVPVGQPQRRRAGPTSPRPPSLRSPTPPPRASNGSAPARIWWSGSSPTLDSPSSHEPSPNPRNSSKNRSQTSTDGAQASSARCLDDRAGSRAHDAPTMV